jgi:hypothetical protein
MNDKLAAINRQKAIQRYVTALDNGNLDDVLSILDEATQDPILDQMIIEVNQAIEQEEGLTTFANDAKLVRDIIQTYFDHPEIPEDERPLTVGEVAAQMQVDRKVPVSDQEIHKRLLKVTTPLPDTLNVQAIRRLARLLKINASEKFWRVFRDTAIMLGIGRGQAQMAAARKQKRSQTSANKQRGAKEDK